MQARTPSALPCSPFSPANTHKQTRPRVSTPSQAPPPSARPHACTQQLHSQSTRDASRAKAGIRSRASRAMQHAAPCHLRSAKPRPPSCHIAPSPRLAACRAKAVPAAATAAVRHSACPTRPFTACRPCRLVANAVATPLKASRRALAQHPPPAAYKSRPSYSPPSRRVHRATSPVAFFLASISLSSVSRARTEPRTPPSISLTSPSQANSSRGKHLWALLHQPQLAAFALPA